MPRHVAIIMDGNGRWARRRLLPRVVGHRAGVKQVRNAVRTCGKKGIEVLTLFAFSSENWRRPATEVSTLMDLFVTALRKEIAELMRNNVRLRVVGDLSAFSAHLQEEIRIAEERTRGNTGLDLLIAANYGGRWDIVHAARRLAERVERGEISAREVDIDLFAAQLSLHGWPAPDLFIRTGGEQRLSNFLLWDLAYSELYFTDTLWPDFGPDAFEQALAWFGSRQRRFGRTGEQVGANDGAQD